MKNIISSIYNPPLKAHKIKLSDLYSKENLVTYFSLARYALKEGIVSLGLKKGDSVLLPSFICRDVLAPFNELGIKVLFYELDESLQLNKNIEKLPAANAIMAVHFFGFETNLASFIEYCNRSGAFLIEDNAHGLFSRNSQNKLLGTRGDIGVISVRKTLPIQNGAMLIQAEKYQKVKQVEIHDYISKNLLIKNRLRPLVAAFGVSFLVKLTEFKRLLRKWKTGHELPTSSDEDELFIPFEANPIDIDKMTSTMDFEEEVKRRRELFFTVREILKNESIKPLRDKLELGEVPYSFPFYCEPSQIGAVKNKLEAQGLELVKWPSLPKSIQEDASTPKFYHSLYLVKFLW